ncbi:unnamed protein product [Vitrella brassicaformis CCMP3155]|uniref:Bis(5'-nucleosyl)-tetraphosphatase [asymmetrical] n=1 Tax=Vitrella brassicaformis (strain CCMP3155) TaxID=1169540 RepID=A0A0G4EL67_VITBC|nr:unnamed protein product [Vitrella brassicaformis CCMP3155]|mmetsp:Transcript_44270/g.110278  ORF Transcript_44270/g.110278 Transcript_44270/m.110278 type:complete len:164 (-) Transcript_44270:66-557(-)|eukprot:CEL97926.1 unnamed protein product [Vitrella brassicaformis CCMP3155]
MQRIFLISMALRAAGLLVFRRHHAPAAGTIKNESIEYLMMQTSYGELHWTPPKGHVDPGESDLQTALRETEEEAGLTNGRDVRLYDWNKELKYEVRGRPKSVIYFLAELVNSDATVRLSDEHQAYRWAALSEACELAKYRDMVETLQQADAFLRQRDESRPTG